MAASTASKSSSAAIRYMAYGWAAFTGTHLTMSHPPVREQLIKATGSVNNFHGLYSAVTFATFLPTTFLYIRYGRGQGVIRGWTELTRSNPAVRAVGLATKAGAAVVFGQAISTPNPIMGTVMAQKNEGVAETAAAEKVVDVRGVYRITRHALFTSLALLGLGNILLRGYAGDVVYWGGYVLIWAVGCPHQDMRQRLQGVLPQEFFDKTSFLPFAAIAEGRNSLPEALKEFNKPVLVVSLVAPIFFL